MLNCRNAEGVHVSERLRAPDLYCFHLQNSHSVQC